MQKRIYAVMGVVALLVGAGAAFAGGDWSGEGEIVEMGCYTKDGSTGEGHAGCAKICFGNGAAMGLLTADGDIVNLVFEDDSDAKDDAIALAGMQAKVTGTESDGVVTVAAAVPAG